MAAEPVEPPQGSRSDTGGTGDDMLVRGDAQHEHGEAGPSCRLAWLVSLLRKIEDLGVPTCPDRAPSLEMEGYTGYLV